MLSKVLTGADSACAQPARFPPVTTRITPRVDSPAAHPDGTLKAELQAATERIRQLEGELGAVRRDAFASGREQGEQQSHLAVTPVLERMTASVAELVAMRAGIRRSAEKDVVQLSLLIAKRILHRELSVDPSALTALARVVFERLTRAETYRVTIHPQFAEAIRSALPASQLGRVQIEADASLQPGTLTVRSEEGLIDASIDVQLEEISRGLTDRLAKAENS